MLYQMADNNLHFYIRKDYQELANSPVVQTPDLKTWIYYDALNQAPLPLPDTVDAEGNVVTEAFTGSRYVTYDQTLGRMRIESEKLLEQNSDTISTVQAFLEHGLEDCLANGYDSLMAVFSSHGGGFAGFGGDENARRKLLQTNQDIATAIRNALENVQGGAISKLDVLGFDACLMQALGAADDYKDVAKYILASEAVEPGHGWAYNYLETAPSALDLAQQILETYLQETQGGIFHQMPKILSIIDTDKFSTFVNAFEDFSKELLRLLQGGDSSLHAYVYRSRASSVAFEGIVDAVGTTKPSALDIGSWMEKLELLCSPSLTGDFGAALQVAKTAYFDMIVLEGVGIGTARGTGMHLDWPVPTEYKANTILWNQVLFQNKNYVTQIVPNFNEFLGWFLEAGVPVGMSRLSVCDKKADTESNAENPPTGGFEVATSLFITQNASQNASTGSLDFTATISLDTSEVSVEYGIDLTTPLKQQLVDKGYEPTDDEYLVLLGGDVVGEYDRDTFSASWDQFFYFLNITGSSTFEALYVRDGGDGSRTVPVLFFPEENREELANLQYLDYLFFNFAYWAEQGARYSFLKFSVDEADGRVNNNLGLFVSNSAGIFTEQPRSGLGYVLPLIYIDAFVQGRKLTILPGGFNSTVIEWKEELDYNILTTPVKNIFKVIPTTDAVVVALTAVNHGDLSSEPESIFYNISGDEAATITQISFTPAPTESPTNAPQSPGYNFNATNAPHSNVSSNIFDHGEGDGLMTDDSDEMLQGNQTGANDTAPISDASMMDENQTTSAPDPSSNAHSWIGPLPAFATSMLLSCLCAHYFQ
ncbi:Clostripain family [Seminavis robusta]|uniref:Clostripain family n=1 Tax=Seminavis robusta TaxID=568900 RepID=A0A9N8DAG7_9STRA|nr:Clostripain family [Seminavis robusta]|eukprot:Sro33_g021450.1 Clostripain family (820) ;mRNA; f:79687-82431